MLDGLTMVTRAASDDNDLESGAVRADRPDASTGHAAPHWGAEDLAVARGDHRGTVDTALAAASLFFALACIAAAALAGRGLAGATGAGAFVVIVFGARAAIGAHTRRTRRAERLAELGTWLASFPFEVRGIALWLGDARATIDMVDGGAHELAAIAAALHEIDRDALVYRVGDRRIRIELSRAEDDAVRTPGDLRLLGRALTSLARLELDGIAIELGGPLRARVRDSSET